MYVTLSKLTYKSNNILSFNHTIIANGNVAEGLGPSKTCGVLCLYSTLSGIMNNMTVTLLNNRGTTGGAIFIQNIYGFTFYNITAKHNQGGDLGILESSNAKIEGINIFGVKMQSVP